MWFQSNCPKILLQHKPRVIHSPATDQPQSYRINGLHTLPGLCIWPAFCLGKEGQDKGLRSSSLSGPPALWWEKNESELWASEGREGASDCTTAKTQSAEVCPVCSGPGGSLSLLYPTPEWQYWIFIPGGNICTAITVAARQASKTPRPLYPPIHKTPVTVDEAGDSLTQPWGN